MATTGCEHWVLVKPLASQVTYYVGLPPRNTGTFAIYKGPDMITIVPCRHEKWLGTKPKPSTHVSS